MEDLPEYITITIDLLETAVPEGVPQVELPYLMRVFYDNFCHENIAIVFTQWLESHEDLKLFRGTVDNEVLRAAGIDENNVKVMQYKKMLEEHGLDAWQIRQDEIEEEILSQR